IVAIYFIFFGVMGLTFLVLVGVIAGKDIYLAFRRWFSKKGCEVYLVNLTRTVSHYFMTPKEGVFRIEDIKKYQSNVLKIKTPTGYEEVVPISLASGKNDVQSIEIVPTLETMVSRFNDALRNTQHDYLWNYMHLDDQEYWESKEKYVTTFKKVSDIRKELGFTIPKLEIGKNIRKLDTWKHKVTGKEYADVVEVPVEAKINENESEINLLYYQKIDGIWKYFTQTNKKESQEEIDNYEELKNLFSN
ncbi:hypothetical protein LCGC14_2427210, partial [marine sediment metagenome]